MSVTDEQTLFPSFIRVDPHASSSITIVIGGNAVDYRFVTSGRSSIPVADIADYPRERSATLKDERRITSSAQAQMTGDRAISDGRSSFPL